MELRTGELVGAVLASSGHWRPQGGLDWVLLVVALVLAVAMALTWFYMATPIGFDGPGRLGVLGLLISLQFLLVTLASAVLAVVAWSQEALLPASLFAAATVLTAVMALWPSIALIQRARESHASVSLGAALIPRRNGGGPQPDRSVVYGTAPDGTELQLDVWRSTSATDGDARLPAFVRVNGGDWVHGARSELVAWDQWLNERGYHVFDVSYRMPPPERWRDEIGDVKSAVAWVAEHSEEYGVDPERISIIGSSAGGNLSMLAAYSMGDPQLPPSCDAGPVRIRSVVNLYGPADLTAMYDHSADNGSAGYVQGALRQYIGGPPGEYPDRYRALSPLTHVTADSPPTLTVLGENDRVVQAEQVHLLEDALAEAGVAHETYLLPFTDHGFDANWTSLSAQLARATVESFLHRYAGPDGADEIPEAEEPVEAPAAEEPLEAPAERPRMDAPAPGRRGARHAAEKSGAPPVAETSGESAGAERAGHRRAT